jgi:glycosyltransferase involved in cell wall biosynthesis
MQNCKPLDILEASELPVFHSTPYPLCTFSRVIKSKGIEDAIIAVNDCNRKLGKTVFTLDIYGMIQEQEWFDTLMSQQSEEIRYRGMVGYNQSTEVLHQYFALLFPTYYQGEGFAGTLIDAMAAGVPSIVSDWRFNAEIITEGKTGYVFTTHSTQELSDILKRIADHPEVMTAMRSNCLQEAKHYLPNVVTRILTEQII